MKTKAILIGAILFGVWLCTAATSEEPPGYYPVTVSFKESWTYANEDPNKPNNPLSIWVTLSAASTQEVRVKYQVTDGSAQNGKDYTGPTEQKELIFNPGVTELELNPGVAILDDGISEFFEYFSISLSDPTNAMLGSITTHAVNIVDDDPPVTVQFATSSYYATEKSGSANIVVTLSRQPYEQVSVDYSTWDAMAIAPDDYLPSSGTLIFEVTGSISQTFTVTIIDDGTPEADESLSMSLSNPVNAELGNPSMAMLMISDMAGDAFLTRLDFVGSGYNDVFSDLGAGPYNAPHWLDMNVDGDADDPGERAVPASYVTVSAVTVTATFVVTGGATSILVKANAGTMSITDTPISVNGGFATLSNYPMTPSLEDYIDYFDPFLITWQASTDGGNSWKWAGTTQNPLYVTLKKPTDILYHTCAFVSCSAAKGEKKEETVAEKVWTKFTPLEIKRKDKPVITLTYYNDWVKALELQTTADLLKEGDGQCSAWVRFFLHHIKAQGAKLPEKPHITVWNKEKPETPGWGFLVPKWDFAEKGTSGDAAYPFKNTYKGDSWWDSTKYLFDTTEVTHDRAGSLKGQGKTIPKADFMNHQLAKIDGIYYDPSYGKKYASVEEFDKSLAGYRKPGGGKTFFYKKNPGDGKNLKEVEGAATGVDP